MLIQHRPQHVQPARIDAAKRLAGPLVASVDQSRLAVELKRAHPPAKRSLPDPELLCLGAVAIHQRHPRPILGPRLALQCVLRAAGAIPGQYLSHMPRALAHHRQLGRGETRQVRTDAADWPDHAPAQDGAVGRRQQRAGSQR